MNLWFTNEWQSKGYFCLPDPTPQAAYTQLPFIALGVVPSISRYGGACEPFLLLDSAAGAAYHHTQLLVHGGRGLSPEPCVSSNQTNMKLTQGFFSLLLQVNKVMVNISRDGGGLGNKVNRLLWGSAPSYSKSTINWFLMVSEGNRTLKPNWTFRLGH